MPNLPMHPVFQEILNSPSLKGTLFVPTARAWDNFFATVRSRQGNPEAPAMVARYGQVVLYHLAQDVSVPIATPTPGTNKFAFDTASTLQCSMGPGLPNNRVVVRKTPQAIFLQHGTGNATIVSQPLPYCGGEAYLVDQVLVPCADVSAIMGEIANVLNPCRNNVEGVLQRNGLTWYNALLLATGINRGIFSAVRDFTIFSPSDSAIQEAYASGSFNFPEMFATSRNLLAGIIAYHAVPQVAHVAPSKATANMETMLSQGHGNATCGKNTLSWRPDGYVYGGTGSAKVGSTYDRGCAAVIFTVDALLQPCCQPMVSLLGGLKAPAGSMTDKALSWLKEQVQNGARVRSTFVLPSEEAWDALKAEVMAVRKKPLTDNQLNALLAYLWSGVDVADVVDRATPMKTGLALLSQKDQRAICPKGTSASLIFAYDKQAPAADDDAVTASDSSAAGYGTPAPAGYAAAPGTSTAYGYPTGYSTAPTTRPGPALPGAGNNAAGLITGFRRLHGTKLPTGAIGATDSLLLPTSFNGLGRSKDGASVVSGPIMVKDGAAAELRLPRGIPVKSVLFACDGSIYRVDTVPLPCNFLGRVGTAPRAAPAPKPALPATMTISAALVNTSNIPAAVTASTVPVPAAVISAAAGSPPLVLAAAAGAALATLLL